MQNHFMSSTPTQVFSDLTETKRFLNITPSETDQDAKIDVSRNMADNYINTQINLHDVIPISPSPPALTSLASALAAAQYNYFQSPEKTDVLKDVHAWEIRVQDFILATFAKKNPNGLAGGVTFGATSAMTGNTSS